MLKTEYVSCKDLKCHPSNPRSILGSGFEDLCDSIRSNPELFEARPIIYSNRTGENIIIAGNMRYKAAKFLKMKKVPAILMENITELQELQIMIRDNVSNGEWDYDMLANDWDVDMLKECGISLPEIESIDKGNSEMPEKEKKVAKEKLCPHCGNEI